VRRVLRGASDRVFAGSAEPVKIRFNVQAHHPDKHVGRIAFDVIRPFFQPNEVRYHDFLILSRVAGQFLS